MDKERYLKRMSLAVDTKALIGAGSFTKGNILLVGEKASNLQSDPDIIRMYEQKPFCSDKGCSKWLNRLLDEENIPEEKLFWINALNNDLSKVDIKKITKDLQPKRVIALGGIAQRVCTEQGVSFEKCYHPQYWKRFHNKERYHLLDLLKELINVK